MVRKAEPAENRNSGSRRNAILPKDAQRRQRSPERIQLMWILPNTTTDEHLYTLIPQTYEKSNQILLTQNTSFEASFFLLLSVYYMYVLIISWWLIKKRVSLFIPVDAEYLKFARYLRMKY